MQREAWGPNEKVTERGWRAGEAEVTEKGRSLVTGRKEEREWGELGRDGVRKKERKSRAVASVWEKELGEFGLIMGGRCDERSSGERWGAAGCCHVGCGRL
ncbi:hypothetical protein AMTR_s00042p00092650 [Amborella trichopoda]|uniref:Uncharacterized protein n=1 Tax=Amborella trichopoda TaxID=13333 RepID=W1P7K2_AMBTC|nr:hypothetical protein AMTR_s00042p00092650 [Amborella trichopoda]